jgi:glutamine synthetase
MSERAAIRLAREATEVLARTGVQAVALTWVDNAGITRVKTVPLPRLEHAVRWGVGMSPVFDVFCVDDSITTSAHIGGPVGDLRLYPDLDRLTVLAGQRGWAWAPVDRRTQEGEVWPACQRSFARRTAAVAADAGIELQMAIEVEWFVGRPGADGDATVPACTGPAYGMTRVTELSDYARDVLAALDAQGVAVDQFHPEYAAGQLELSTAATDPVGAADTVVLVKQTIRAISFAHGLVPSFAPVVVLGQVGNGGHVHLSAWSAGVNMMTGGDGPHGLTGRGEAIVAGLLARLPALCAIGSPSVTSYYRLVPHRWAGAFQCWGLENREAAVRLVKGSTGNEETAANVELKCFDASANPYLLAGAVASVVAASVDSEAHLPGEVTVDPAGLPPSEQPARLPQSLPEAVAALEADEVLRAALGEPLTEAFLAVRRAEVELCTGRADEEVVALTRWVY